MKRGDRLWLSVSITALLTCLCLADGGGDPKVGEPAPIFVAKTYQGEDFFLRDYCGEPRGKRHRQERNILVLSFFTTWCQPCRQEISMLQELAAHYRDDGVLFFLVNKGQSQDTVEDFLYEQVISLPVILDRFEVLARKFAVRELPTLVVINWDGILAEYHSGYRAEYRRTLVHKLDSLVGRKPDPGIWRGTEGKAVDRRAEGKKNTK